MSNIYLSQSEMETLYIALNKQDNDLEIDKDNITDDKVLETFLREEQIILSGLKVKVLKKIEKTGNVLFNSTKSEKEYKYDAVWDNINN